MLAIEGSEVVTYIASTDTSLGNVNEHIMVVFQLRLWPVLEYDIFDGPEHK